MKYRHSDVLKGIIGIVLIISAITGIYYWETYGRQAFTTKKVVVLKEALPPNKLITEEDLEYVNRETTTLTEHPVLTYDEIVGKVTKHFVPANTQLILSYFEEDGLLPKEGEYVFQLPPDWIRSCPSTLRRSDDAYIYPVRRGVDEDGLDREEMHQEIAELVDEIDSESQTADEANAVNEVNELELEADADSENAQTASEEPAKEENSEDKQMYLEPIRCLKIAFVKNQSNQEVKSISSQDRLNGTSTISTIEMIATMEDIELLTALHDNGYDFIIMYR